MDGEKVSGAGDSTFTSRFAAATQELEPRLEPEPGVTGVTVASLLLLMDHPWRRIEVDEGNGARGERNARQRNVPSASVSLDFFDVLAPRVSPAVRFTPANCRRVRARSS